jgi:hypothetical protein
VYDIPLLDPDAIGKALQPTITGTSAVAAARHVLVAAQEHIYKRESFAVETTLSGQGYLRMMIDARARGFEVVLVYIGTESVELNLARIRDRVLAGGHNVPEEDVRRRYRRKFRQSPNRHPTCGSHHPVRQLNRRRLPSGCGSQPHWKSVVRAYSRLGYRKSPPLKVRRAPGAHPFALFPKGLESTYPATIVTPAAAAAFRRSASVVARGRLKRIASAKQAAS